MTRNDLPTGEVTFLFTDIEGSTRLVQELGESWPETLAAHGAILTRAIEENGGVAVNTEGDSFFAVFVDPQDGVAAAVDAQKAVDAAVWKAPLRVRMGVHTGLGVMGGSDYVGIDVHRASRIADAAHGGQIVVSEQTALEVESRLPPGAKVRDLGKYRLKDLADAEAIFQVDIEGLQREFPPLRTLDVIPNNLPGQLTPFVGRDAEVKRVVDALGKGARLVTLTGPGGTGKTRLALQVAAEASHRYPDGVFFSGLSPVNDTEVVPSVLLGDLGLTATGAENPRDRLLAELADKKLLMVLDNFEQILPAAELVAVMVREAPRSQFLVTSRAPLKVRGEQELAIPPLQLPATRSVEGALASESVQLLVELARSVQAEFEVTEDNVADVIELVERLDGLPLAVELITPRLRLFSVAAIVERLDARMLSAGPVDLPERQRTIDAAIAWSHDLLEPEVKLIFAHLSVFAGGVRLEDVERFFGRLDSDVDLFSGLAELVDQSLLGRGHGDRFRMLHVIREFAADRLEESEEADLVRRAHLELYTAIVETSAGSILGADRARLLDEIELEHDNVRTALEWGLSHGEVSLVLRLSSAMWRFWQARGHLFEATGRLPEALAMEGAAPEDRVKGLEAMGGVHWWRGDLDESVATYDKALTLQREIGGPADIANAMYNYGLARAAAEQSLESAEPLLKEALDIYTELGDENGIGNVNWGLGQSQVFLHRLDDAEDRMGRAVEAYRNAGNLFGLSWAEYEQGMIALGRGRDADAWNHIKAALELFKQVEDVSGYSLAAYGAAAVAFQTGDLERAYRLYGAVESMVEESGARLVRITANVFEGLSPDDIAALTGDHRIAYDEGRAMDTRAALAYALGGHTVS